MNSNKSEEVSLETNLRQQVSKHVRLASPLVGTGIRVALLLNFLPSGLKSKLKKLPLFGGVLTLAESFLALHSEVIPTSDNRPCQHHLESEAKVYDTIFVGSGPGAAIGVSNLSSEKSFLVLEKGSPINPNTPHHSVGQMMENFAYGGQEVIFGTEMIPFSQGSAYGGGSSINSGLYHRLPDHVRSIWLDKINCDSETWAAAEKHVESMISVETQLDEHLGIYRGSPLKSGAKSMGLEFACVPRWRNYFNATDYKQQSVDVAIIEAKRKLGQGDVFFGMKALRFKVLKDKVSVTATCEVCRGEFSYSALSLYLCAGAVETPALLLRSNFARARDFSFSFHAMHRLVAFSDSEINDGVDIDPHQAWTADHKYKFGAAVSTASLMRGVLKLVGAQAGAQGDIRKVATYYVSHASEGKSGIFRIGGNCHPYFFGNQTYKNRVVEGFGYLKDLLEGEGLSVPRQKISTSTVHIFGTIPIGSSNLVDDRGWIRGARGVVRVFDASLLPTHPKVNPQGPLMHLLESLATAR